MAPTSGCGHGLGTRTRRHYRGLTFTASAQRNLEHSPGRAQLA